MTKINLNSLSPEERAELLKQATEELKQAEVNKKNQRQAYKDLVDETLPKFFDELVSTSRDLSKQKKRIIDGFKDLIQMKCELYEIDKDKQMSHTFSNKDNSLRITLGYYTLDSYDDTLSAGVQKVKDYLDSLTGEDAKVPVKMVNKLLAKDNAGNIKAQRVLQLAKIAEETGNTQFIDAVKIIQDSYKPVKSKQYIRAEYKNDDNKWISVPLGLTEVDINM